MKNILKNKKNIIITILICTIIIFCVLIINMINAQKCKKTEGYIEMLKRQVYNEKIQKKDEFVKNEKDGTRVNISGKLNEEREITNWKNVVVTDVKIETKNNNSVVTLTIKNNNKNNEAGAMVTMNFIDEDNNSLIEAGVYINELEPNEQIKATTVITTDISNTYDYTIGK